VSCGLAFFILRRLRPLALLIVLGPIAGCHRHETAASATQAVLERQRTGLAALAAAARAGTLVPFHDVLVVADERLVAQVIAASMPYEQVIRNRYRIRVTRAEVHFEDGFGLVRLEGEASFADKSTAQGHADITLYGALDVVELDPESGILRGGVTVIALDARRVDVFGVKSLMAEDIVEDLGREKLETFAALVSKIEIPVKLERSVSIPAVGPGEVTIDAAAIALHATVTNVTAFRGKLWVSVDVSAAGAAAAASPPAAAASAAPTAERAAGTGDLRRFRADFADLVARDPVVTEALAQGGDVTVGIRPTLAQALLGAVAAHYLDNVVLDLPLEKHLTDSHEVSVGTFLGHINAGTWTLDVTLHRIQGRLRARTPKVAAGPDNTLTMDLPVVLEEGHGTATVHFAWNSHSVASVLCHDFELTRNLSGIVLSHEYAVSGAFALSAGPDALRAEPRFPPHEFRIHTDMAEGSWKEVRAAIDDQDQVSKCGLALDPEQLLAKLRARLHEGFDVKLPRSLFRPIDFPAAVREQVTIEDRKVDLDVKTHGLAVTPVAAWYAADVHTRIEAASPASR
jgi:hypothetical protein